MSSSERRGVEGHANGSKKRSGGSAGMARLVGCHWQDGVARPTVTLPGSGAILQPADKPGRRSLVPISKEIPL